MLSAIAGYYTQPKKRGCGTSNGSCRTVGVAEYCGSELGIRRVPVWSNVGVRWGGGALGVLPEGAGSTWGVLGEYVEIECRCQRAWRGVLWGVRFFSSFLVLFGRGEFFVSSFLVLCLAALLGKSYGVLLCSAALIGKSYGVLLCAAALFGMPYGVM